MPSYKKELLIQHRKGFFKILLALHFSGRIWILTSHRGDITEKNVKIFSMFIGTNIIGTEQVDRVLKESSSILRFSKIESH